jgi:hypothetical protein
MGDFSATEIDELSSRLLGPKSRYIYVSWQEIAASFAVNL